jgi:hypothetical protein
VLFLLDELADMLLRLGKCVKYYLTPLAIVELSIEIFYLTPLAIVELSIEILI